MATIKTYSDLQQSKKLAEILPLESADMHYKVNRYNDEYKIFMTPYSELGSYKDNEYQYSVCAWSLAALLGVYPMIVGRDMDMYCCWQNSKHLCSRHYDNPVDACYEMIIKLHEQNLL